MIVLCKFFSKKEYAEDFLKGNIYLKSARWFRNIESPVKGQEDTWEGMEYVFNGNDIDLNVSGLKVEGVIKVSCGRDYVAENLKLSCFCMLNFENGNQNLIDDRMRDFGEFVVLIYNGVKFSEIITNYCTTNPEEHLNYGCCEYKPDNEISGKYHPLIKLDIFEYQNEWRFYINKNTGEKDFYYINIGDISDIANLYTTDEFFKNCKKVSIHETQI